MCIIPLDVQRRCERRWAAQFSRPPEFEIGRTSKSGAGKPADRRARQQQKTPGWKRRARERGLTPTVIDPLTSR